MIKVPNRLWYKAAFDPGAFDVLYDMIAEHEAPNGLYQVYRREWREDLQVWGHYWCDHGNKCFTLRDGLRYICKMYRQLGELYGRHLDLKDPYWINYEHSLVRVGVVVVSFNIEEEEGNV